MTTVVLACVLLALGLYGVLTRKEIVAVLASIEVMLGGANLIVVAYGASLKVAAPAQGFALIVLVVVAAEAAVGLALLFAMIRRGRTRTDEIREVSG